MGKECCFRLSSHLWGSRDEKRAPLKTRAWEAASGGNWSNTTELRIPDVPRQTGIQTKPCKSSLNDIQPPKI